MQLVTIDKNQAGQRFDKFLHKYLPEAGTSFLYKMLRKKNITLNGKKAEGKEDPDANKLLDIMAN
jgi:23S rRNA pseudouridine955/2504/2580 synthase